jgi:hypothetical protein
MKSTIILVVVFLAEACGPTMLEVPRIDASIDAPMLTCDPGLTADCNRDRRDNCEVQIDRDLRNCGRCGVVCRASSVCSAGSCFPP